MCVESKIWMSLRTFWIMLIQMLFLLYFPVFYFLFLFLFLFFLIMFVFYQQIDEKMRFPNRFRLSRFFTSLHSFQVGCFVGYFIFRRNNPFRVNKRRIKSSVMKVVGFNWLFICLLVLVHGISTFVGYSMPNPFFIKMNSSISNNLVYHE